MKFTNSKHAGTSRAKNLARIRISAPVELPYISCKNLAEVVHIRHYLQES